jgi:glycosyltransferase involved in cell wall biosynthesis
MRSDPSRGPTGAAGAALLPEVGVLGLVPDPFNAVWQPRQQVLLRLARYFHVVWVNPAQSWRWWERSGINGAAAACAPVEDADRFTVYTPWLPLLYRPARLARAMERARLKHARAILARRGCTAIVLSLWRPQFAEALELVRFDQSCYHIDDEYSFAEQAVPLGDHERRLIGAVDQVFVTSRGLLAGKGGINPHTDFVPNGVDFAAYAAPWPEPPDLAAIPRPRIGYTGVVKPQLDWPLLEALAASRPDWSFVFVGPIQREPRTLEVVARLGRRANVHFLGLRSLEALAAYPQHFDVCIMPYRLNHYTDQIYPLKLHEYLASGRPTVGTPISTLTTFPEVVRLAHGPREWVQAIAEALGPTAITDERRTARQRVARDHDWDGLVQQIARTIAGRLGPAWAARLDEAVEHRAASGAAGFLSPADRRGPDR